MAYGLALYGFLSIVELYITVPQRKFAQTDQQKGGNIPSSLKTYFSPKNIFPNCFPPDGTCPPPFSYVPGDVSGPGTLDYETHSMGNMTRCL